MTIPKISFEFFAPKTMDELYRLWNTVHALSPLGPRFVSVTSGAGGVSRESTRAAVEVLHNTSGFQVVPHMTCVGASRNETLKAISEYAEAGISEIVVLRGDPPKGSAKFVPYPEGFETSLELISALADTGKFKIRVGAYPEAHPEALSPTADIEFLKRKIDAGASEAITQFFFEAKTFFRFRDACQKAGIKAPITPGILPIENWRGTLRLAKACKTAIPSELITAFTKAELDDRKDLLATEVCSDLCSELIKGGVTAFHFYTLNRPNLTRGVCDALGIGV